MDNMKRMEKRMTNIENTLDQISNNHLAHIEKYTKFTMVGIIITGCISLSAVYISVVM